MDSNPCFKTIITLKLRDTILFRQKSEMYKPSELCLSGKFFQKLIFH